MKQILIFLLLSTAVGFAQSTDQPATSGTPQDSNAVAGGITIYSGSSSGESGQNLHTYVFFDSENKKVYTLAIAADGKEKEQTWTFKDLNELEEESKNKKKR